MMAGLSLIADYSSDVEDEGEIQPVKLRFPTPSLPKFVLPRSITREPENDPGKHQNRKRSFAHEAGNWATYIGIVVPCLSELDEFLHRLEHKLKKYCLQPIESLHISLTRVVILRHHWINSFVDSVKDRLNCMLPFCVNFQGLSVFVNDDETRTFIALNVKAGLKILNDIVARLDQCLLEYSLPQFYEEGSFHVSLFWCHGNQRQELEKALLSLPGTINNFSFSFSVDGCFCKIGNKLFNISFS